MNTFGKHFRITSFGESHGPAMGVVVDGCPSNVPFSIQLLKNFLERRRPGKFSWTSRRQEADEPQILSGVFQDKTLGTPIAVAVMNQGQRSEDYKNMPQRLGHADDLWKEKFGHSDPRGGGRASGRETVSRVMGGAFARMFLNQICPELKILAYTQQVGSFELQTENVSWDLLWKNPERLAQFPCFVPDKELSTKIEDLLLAAQKDGQSYGGRAGLKIKGVPQGLGQPVFCKLKSELSGALMGLGAVCGVFIGSDVDSMAKGGQSFHTHKKYYGGLRGGLSTGDTIEIQVYFKPVSTVGSSAQKGRHDPCVIPRALVVLESMVYLVLADHVLARRLDQA